MKYSLKYLDSPWAIHIIVAAATVIRLGAIAVLGRRPLVGDAQLYDEFARRMLQGQSIYPLVPPGEGSYLALCYRVFGAIPLVARACMVPLAIAFFYAFHAAAVKFAGRRSANLAALVFAIYPLQILCSIEPITEMPAALLLMLSLLLVLSILARPGPAGFALLGLALGLLILTRPSALPFIVVLPAFLLLRSRNWLGSAIAAAIPALMIAAWIGGVYHSTGHFVMINFSSTQNVFLGNNPYTPLYRTWWLTTHGDNPEQLPAAYRTLNAQILRAPWYEQNGIYRRAALQSIVSRPDLFLLRTANRIRVYFAFDSYTGSLLLNRYRLGRKLAFAAIALDGALFVLFAASALLFLFTVPHDYGAFRPALIIAGMIAIYAGPYFLSVSHPIYHFPTVPLMGLLAAGLWSGLPDWQAQILARPEWPIANQSAAVGAAILFIYVQVEYAFVMYHFSSR